MDPEIIYLFNSDDGAILSAMSYDCLSCISFYQRNIIAGFFNQNLYKPI
jgi:hypothetical protein